MYMDLKKISGGWAVQNLRQYGNSLLPPELIKDYGAEKIEGVLSTILAEPVWIDKLPFPGEITPNGINAGKKGYKLTTSRDEIRRSVSDNDRRAYTMLRQTRHVRKALCMTDQMSLFDQEDKA